MLTYQGSNSSQKVILVVLAKNSAKCILASKRMHGDLQNCHTFKVVKTHYQCKVYGPTFRHIVFYIRNQMVAFHVIIYGLMF